MACSPHADSQVEVQIHCTADANVREQADTAPEAVSDTSSESDVEQMNDIQEMREMISRMDDDDDGGDQDK